MPGGKLAPSAEKQMNWRQVRALHWPVYIGYDETTDRDPDPYSDVQGNGVPQWHLRCAEDGQSVGVLMSGGTAPHIPLATILDNIVRHMVQCHSLEEEAIG